MLKVLAEAELVRRMDVLILSSHGGYADRSEFVAEALRDRIQAEEELHGLRSVETEVQPGMASEGHRESTEQLIAAVSSASPEWQFGDWLGRDVPTLPPTIPAETVNYGLHNRDFPTLWALDVLGRLTTQAGAPVPWSAFVEHAAAEAWPFGEAMAAMDLSRPSGLKRSAGFPLNRKKRDAAVIRFRDHAIGTLGRTARGPVFVFGVVGVDDATREPEVAVTPAGLQLLTQLGESGVGDGPPFGSAAWAWFSAHLRAHAADELHVWRSVLAAMIDKPNRRQLVSRCDWWSGSVADTNVMGYIARGREWGLVKLGLDEGRYELTELGRTEASNHEDGS